MTTAQLHTITTITDKLAADRWNAEQAARDVAELDVRSVLLVVEAKLAAGLVDEAKAIVTQWKAGQL